MSEELKIRISGDIDKFDDALSEIRKRTQGLERKLSSIAKISGVAFAGLTATIGLNVREFAKFDNQLRSVRTLLDETSFGSKGVEKGFADMRKEALALQGQVPSSIEAVNKALFDSVSAGVDAAEAVKFVGTASKLAVAGVTDVSIATNGLTSALNAYSIAANKADSVAAKFFTAQKFGKTTIEELSSGFGLVGSSASALGVGFEELLASVSAVTLAGVKTNSAYTGMKAVLANISKPTKEAQKEAKRLGVEFNAQALRAKGLTGFLDSLTSANGFTKDSIIELFGSVEAQNILFALAGEQAGAYKDTLAALTDEISNQTTFTKAFEIQNASLQNQMEILGKQFQVVAIQIGEKLAPIVGMITQKISSLLTMMGNNPGLTTFVAAVLAGSTALAGLVTVLATAAIVYLKLSTGLAAYNVQMGTNFGLTQSLTKAKQVLSATWIFLNKQITISSIRLGIHKAAMLASSAATTVATAAMRVFGVATKASLGWIALAVTAVASLAYYFKDELLVVMKEVIPYLSDKLQMATVIGRAALVTFGGYLVNFKDNILNTLGGIGDILVGIFTLDKDKIISGFESARKATANLFFTAGSDSAKLFNDAVYAQFEETPQIMEESAKEVQKTQLDIADDTKSQLIAKERDYAEELKAEKLRLAMELLAQDAEFQALSDEQKAEFVALNREKLVQDLEIDREIRNRAIVERLANERKANQQYLKDRMKFGKAYAEINRIINMEAVQGAANAGQELIKLQRSNNSTLKGIGKAFAIADITMKTAQSAMNIYNGFSTIPIVGQALGIAGAAAAVAFGAEQIGQVQGANKGGLMVGGIQGIDSIPAMLTPGELVAPAQNFDEVVNAVADRRNAQSEGGGALGGAMEVIIGFRDDAFEIIEERLLERRATGIGSI